MKYAELLQSYIEQSRLTLDEISEKISEKGLTASKQYISKLQNGKTPPASEKLNTALAEILDGDVKKLEFLSFVEKAPESIRFILENFDEDVIKQIIAFYKVFPDRDISFNHMNDSDIEESQEFEIIKKHYVQIKNKLEFESLKQEFGHLDFFVKNEHIIKNHLKRYGLASTLTYMFELENQHSEISHNSNLIQEDIKDPELLAWYKKLPLSGEKKLGKLRTIWEMMQDDDE